MNGEVIRASPFDDVSYESLKKKYDSYSVAYKFWLNIAYWSYQTNFWTGFLIYSCLTLYVILCTKYWLIALLYIFWIYYDRKTPHTGGRKIKNWNPWTSKYLRDYFPLELVKTVDLPADKNYIFIDYPHGVFCAHQTINFYHETTKFKKLFPNIEIYGTTLAHNFYAPITRDYFLSSDKYIQSHRILAEQSGKPRNPLYSIVPDGFSKNIVRKFDGHFELLRLLLQCLVAVTEEGIKSVLTKKPNSGRACIITVGGGTEAHYVEPEEYIVIAKNRSGFIRIALQTGTPIVPVFGFGENRLYDVAPSRFPKIKEIIHDLMGCAWMRFSGKKIGPFYTDLPHSVPLITVVGKPIYMPKIENPTKEEISHYRQKFMDELYDLFEKHKSKYDALGSKAKLTFL